MVITRAIAGGSNQMAHYEFGPIAYGGLAGAALLWGYVVWLFVESRNGLALVATKGD